MRYLFLLLLSFVCNLTFAAFPGGPENKYNIIYNFEKDWTEYDQDLKLYTPYILKNNNDSKAFSLRINLNDYPGGFLVIKTPRKGNFLFFDNHLKRTLPANKWVVYSIRQLIQEIKKEETVLSIFGSNLPEENIVFIGFPSAKTTKVITKTKNSFLNLTPRSTEQISSSLVFVFIINIIMLSFIATNYTKAFKKYYNFKDLSAIIPKESTFLINKPMDRPNMMFIIMASLILGFIVMLNRINGLNLLEEKFFFESGDTFGTLTTFFFKTCLFFFISFVIKYFFLNLTGKLFNIRKIVDIHYFKVIQTTLYFFSIVLILLLIGFNAHLIPNAEFKYLLTSTLLVFYFLRTILIYLTINRTGNIKTLYLISYLCIVEVFPIVLGIRILF